MVTFKQLSHTEGCLLLFLYHLCHLSPHQHHQAILTPVCFPLNSPLFSAFLSLSFYLCFLAASLSLSLSPTGTFVCLYLKYSKQKTCCFVRQVGNAHRHAGSVNCACVCVQYVCFHACETQRCMAKR